MLIKVYIYW